MSPPRTSDEERADVLAWLRLRAVARGALERTMTDEGTRCYPLADYMAALALRLEWGEHEGAARRG